MAKKTGLGKGLGALFNDNIIDDENDNVEIKEGEEVVKKIKIIDIEPNKNQPRRNFNNESIEITNPSSIFSSPQYKTFIIFSPLCTLYIHTYYYYFSVPYIDICLCIFFLHFL